MKFSVLSFKFVDDEPGMSFGSGSKCHKPRRCAATLAFLLHLHHVTSTFRWVFFSVCIAVAVCLCSEKKFRFMNGIMQLVLFMFRNGKNLVEMLQKLKFAMVVETVVWFYDSIIFL